VALPVYQVLNPRELLRLRGRRVGPKVARNVVLLGLVSLFTDVSSEIVTTILPLYLVYTLGFSPLQFGIVDGLQQGAAAIVRVAGGFAADRTRRHKEVAIVGYGLSAFARLGLLATSSLQALSTVVFLDRTGKGIRTAPRDALISLSSDRDSLGAAFGVHRALDTAGAMIGPLLAFGLLWLNPGEFDPIFVVSFCFGLIGLAILVLFVENRPVPVADAAHVSLRAALRLLGRRRFATLAVVGAALAVFTISDGFLFLALQRHLDFEERLLPILFVGTAGAFMLLAIPVGRLADRVGRGRVFLAGYVPLFGAYLLLLVPAFGSVEIALFLLLLGLYYAATDGVLMALASTMLPAALRGSGLALLVTATSLGRLLASIVFGTIWTWQDVDTAIAAFAVGLLVAMVVAATALRLAAEMATVD
jgi:MFS family permease